MTIQNPFLLAEEKIQTQISPDIRYPPTPQIPPDKPFSQESHLFRW